MARICWQSREVSLFQPRKMLLGLGSGPKGLAVGGGCVKVP